LSTIVKKIALINPSTYTDSEKHIYEMYRRNIGNYKPYLSPPLNLLTIASHTPTDIEVKVLDENIEAIDFNSEYDLVGITAMTQQAFRAYNIAFEFRKRNIPVVMGGIHASVMPEEALQHVDSIFIGESEEQWKIYIDDLKTGAVKRIYQSDTLFDLEKSVIPKYELINYDVFKLKDSFIRLIPVQATRGCPHDCSFCIVPDFYGRCIRKKNISQVIKEIEYVKKLNYDSLFLFVDDNLFVDRKYIKTLMKELIPLKISYIAQTDIKVANDDELLELAYKSGCILMLIGFESIDSINLSEINVNKWKMRQLDSYTSSINKIQEQGIIVFGSFIVGFEHDDASTFQKIRDFVIRNNMSAHFTMLTALPGSRLYKQFKTENRFIKDVFWDDLSFYNLNFNHKHINKEMAEKGIVWLYDEVYNDENAINRYRHMMQLFKQLPGRWIS
jgi:radical SAM superfamily enzyme YgiQ (UPF0313 family)